MTVLVVGGTGATGKLLLEQLLSQNINVRAVVRDVSRVPEQIRSHPNLDLVEGSLLKLDEKELKKVVKGCTSIVSCLGHNLSFKGMFGPPFRLVTRAVERLTTAVESGSPVKFIFPRKKIPFLRS